MLELLQKLIVGHVHKWKSVAYGPIINNGGSVTGFYRDLECEHCGKHKYWEGK